VIGLQPTVVLGFDMETDIGSWTPYYNGLVHGTPKILDVLAKHDVKATFLYTGDSAQTHPEIVRLTAEAGQEIGCHSLFHETVGDEIFPIPGVKPLLPEECFHRIELATEIVQDVLGDKVTSFRAPRLWGSTALVNALERLGYLTDLTYPMYFYKDRLIPYHPDSSDWTRQGDMKLLEIPNFADMTIESSDSYGRDRDQWPLFRTEGADALMRHVDNMLGFYNERGLQAVFCLYMHPWEFYEMPQGAIYYGEGAVLPDSMIVKNCGEVAVRELDRLLAKLIDKGFTFCTAQEMAEQF
jgi:peptidoglycan/xylan/chitin deacetylase (PgdA/CDA1 family)